MTYVKDIHGYRDSIKRSADSLKSLARAFDRTGNADVAMELRHIAEMVESDAEAIVDTIGEHLRDQLKESQNNIAETFKVMLEPKT